MPTRLAGTGGPVDWSASVDADGNRNYTVTHLVEVTKAFEGSTWPGPAEVLQTTGLPVVGSTWSYGLPTPTDVDVWAFCTLERKIKRYNAKDGEPVRFYTVESAYTTKPRDRCATTEVGDPLSEPAKISVKSSTYSEEADFDRFGRPILTSSHEQIRGSQVEFDTTKFGVTISQNVRDPNYPLLAAMVNTVSANAIWGFPRRCVRLGHFTVERNYQNQCTPYYTRNLEFEVWGVNDGSRYAVLGIATSNSGGGYTVGDVLTLVGGTGSDSATILVVATSAGAISAAFLLSPGSYSAVPAGPAAVSGGTGTGATFDLFTGPGLTPGWDKDLNDEGTKVLSGRWNRTTGAWEDVNVNGSPPNPMNPAHFIRYKDKLGENARVILDGAGRPYDPDHPPTTFVDRSMGFPFGGGRLAPSANTSGLAGAPASPAAVRVYGGGMTNEFIDQTEYKVTAFDDTGETAASAAFDPGAGWNNQPSSSVKLTWTAVTGAKGYRVYRKTSIVASNPVYPGDGYFKLLATVGSGQPGVIHVEKYGESDFTVLNVPLFL